MNTAECIHVKVMALPSELAEQVLDFVLFLEDRHSQNHKSIAERESSDLVGENDKPNKQALAQLLANSVPLREDVSLPINREEIYDRPCLR